MGKRGPPRTPTPILKLRGSWLANAREKVEPKAKLGRPVRPAGLSRAAVSVWKQIVPELDEMGVLAKIDRNALHRYCETFAMWKRMEKFIRENGEAHAVTRQDQNGNRQLLHFTEFPQVRIYHKAAELLHRLEAQFGMTPSARASIALSDDMMPDRQTELEAKFFGSSA